MTTDSLYKRALLEVGQYGKFQQRFDIVYIIILSSLWCMAYNNIVLALTVIPHTCKLSLKNENISKIGPEQYVTSSISGENILLGKCTITYTSNNKTTECDEYTYDTTWYGSTIPSQNNWVCDGEIYQANVFAYMKISETIGSLVFGWFGDRCGRKPTYMISLGLLIFGRVLSVITSYSFPFFVLGCIIAAFPATSALQSISLICIETSSPKRRSKIAKYRMVASSFGISTMPLLYWWLRDWKPFLIITTLTQLPYLIFSWKMIESPEWLWVNTKSKSCILQLKRIGKVNNSNLEYETETEILTQSEIAKREDLGLRDLFSSKELAVNTTLQLFLWVSTTLSYSVSFMSSGEKSDGNPFFEFAWQALAEVPAHFSAAWLVDHLGRRYTGMLSSGLTSALWIILGVKELDSFWWLHYGWISTFLAVANRFSITVAYYTINLLNMELYPTRLRQSGMSLGDVISGGAASIAAYVFYAGHRYGTFVSSAILSTVSILGLLSSYYLPETLNAKLPETLEEAREFGKRARRRILNFSL